VGRHQDAVRAGAARDALRDHPPDRRDGERDAQRGHRGAGAGRRWLRARARGGVPDSKFGKALRNVAQCAKGSVGLEVATVDIDSWDHHTALGNHLTGQLATKLRDLAAGLAALRTDLGELWATTTVAVVSEFGRRLEENGDGGVDHGHGGLMLVLGGGIRGGQVYGRWPGLAAGDLDHGDLAVTTDWRQVYAELVAKRLGNAANLAAVFPGLTPAHLGLANPRTD